MAFRTLILVPCLCLNIYVYAQAPYLYFNKVNTQDGLSHNKVNCILQDQRGFMWIGTDDGLNRYDGRYFTAFRHQPNNPTTVSGNIIRDLLEDKNGILWIATGDGGLTRYNYRLPPAEQFKQYKHLPNDSSSIPVNTINDLLEDKHGWLWLASDGKGVLRFRKETEKFEIVPQEGTRNAVTLCLDAQDQLWVGRQGGGLLKVNTKNLSYSMDPRYQDLYANLPHATVSSLFRDRADNIWFGSWDRVLYRYNASSGEEEAFRKTVEAVSFSEDDVLAFAEDASGRIWMGGRFYGLTLFDKGTNRFFNYRYDVSREGTVADNRINCVYIDRSGLTWLGTNKGISLYNPQQQPFVQTFLPKNGKNISIYDFYQEDDGSLWIGTSNGLYIRKPESSDFEHLPLAYKGQQLAVSCFFEDYDGKFFIGTNFSFFEFDRKLRRLSLLQNTEKDPVIYDIIESRVVSVVRDTIGGHPVLIVSPYGHYLVYYDLVEKHWVSRTDTSKKIVSAFNLQDNLIRKLVKLDKKVWLATGKAGLGEWNNDSTLHVRYYKNDPVSPSSISNDNVYDLASDTKGNLWVTTFGGGLNMFTPADKKFMHVPAASNLLEGINVDDNDNVWMISNGNLHRYRPGLRSFSSFGLPDLEKSGGVRGYIYKDKKGRMYVAGTDYYIAFDPLAVNAQVPQPKVHFTDFRVFNQSHSDLLSKNEIGLRYDQNYFTVEFSAPDFTGGKVEYSYLLEGVDKDWVEAGSRNIVSYSNLEGGNYAFRVRATNRKGNWGSDHAILNIAIIPPFWERWWFFAICALFVGSGVYAFYRYRINELLKRQAIRNRIAQDLHDNVGSTLSSISVYSQVARIYKEQEEEEDLQDTLERIGVASNEMISEMNDIVWAINPRNDNMETIMQRMESYAKPILHTKEIAFGFNYDPAISHLHIEMEQRKNFYLIFKEAVCNALKYSRATRIDVQISLRQRWIEMYVKDNGDGFEVKAVNTASARSLSGNGLYNMKRRAADMGGECSVASTPGNGTTVTLRFPIT